MLSSFRQLAIRSSVAQTRTLASSSVLLAKTIDAEKAKLKKLQASLKKEKLVLSQLKTKHKTLLDKHKQLKRDRKAAKLEKKEKDRAFKPYRKITGLNIYIKEKVGQGATIATVGKGWSHLTEGEKQAYQDKADALNEVNGKIYRAKPVPPPNLYASFIKQKWVKDDGRTFGEISKELAAQWKQLTKDEKDVYAPSADKVAAYKKELKSWEDERLEIHRAKATSA